VLSEALHDLGCMVLEANDGLAGWQIVQSDTPIDLLITDVGLPGMNGRQLAEAAQAHRPGLPVLVITGYAGPASGGFALPPGMRLLRKPFTLGDLTPLLAEILHPSGRPLLGRPLPGPE
jgi:CheY-like chemotaxis protein